MNVIFRLLKAEVSISYTAAYEGTPSSSPDMRYRFDSRKHTLSEEKSPENRYRQVFSSIHGFLPDLSIIDLLFNEGPRSADYLLRKSQ